MPYTVPTVQDFKDRFPEITATDPQIQSALNEGAAAVDTTWLIQDYQPAILYFAAHVLRSGQIIGGPSAGISSESFGGYSVSYRTDLGYWSTTVYGNNFYRLLRRNKYGARVVA